MAKYLDISKLDAQIVSDIAENMGWNAEEKPDHLPLYVSRISHLTVEQAFERWMTWHGMIDWAGHVTHALDTIRAAETETPETEVVQQHHQRLAAPIIIKRGGLDV